MDTNCTSVTKTGEPCGATHYRDGWCYWHHPDLEAERQANRVAGGKARANTSRARKKMADQVMSIADIDAALCAAMQQVGAGTLEPGIGTAMATIAKTVVGIRTASDFERQLAELKQVIGTDTSRRFVS